MAAVRACAIDDGCRGPVPSDAPIALCAQHLAIAAEWSQARDGVIDALPGPCLLCGSRVGVRFPSAWVCAVCEWRFGDVPDEDLPPPRVDVVYYLRYDDRVKIGTTANPRQRLSAIRHDEVLAFERGDRELEHRRHVEFDEERWRGTEWFRLSARLVQHIDAVASGRDPWSVHARWTSEAAALRG